MFFEDFASFAAMGGHGLYVWLSYGIATLIVAINFVSPMLTRKKIIKDIERQLRREQK